MTQNNRNKEKCLFKKKKRKKEGKKKKKGVREKLLQLLVFLNYNISKS